MILRTKAYCLFQGIRHGVTLNEFQPLDLKNLFRYKMYVSTKSKLSTGGGDEIAFIINGVFSYSSITS